MAIDKNLKICGSVCFFAAVSLFLCAVNTFAQSFKEDMEKAEFLSKSGKHEDAINLYKKIVINIKNPEVKREINEKIAKNYIFTTFHKDEDEKIKIFEMILKKYPDTDIAYKYCMEVPNHFYKMGKYKKALHYYQEIIKKYLNDDNSQIALFKISEIRLKQGGYKDAFTVGRQLADKYPESFRGLFSQIHVAEKYYKTNQFQKALEICFEILGYVEKDLKRAKFKRNAYTLMVEIYLEMGKFDHALEIVRKKEQETKFSENDLRFFYSKIANYFSVIDKNYPRALEIYEDIYEKFPQNVAIVSNLAHLYELIGEYDKAIKFYNEYLGLEPEDKSIPPYTHISLMNCYMKIGDFAKAQGQCNIILELSPENKEAQKCLEQIESETQNKQ